MKMDRRKFLGALLGPSLVGTAKANRLVLNSSMLMTGPRKLSLLRDFHIRKYVTVSGMTIEANGHKIILNGGALRNCTIKNVDVIECSSNTVISNCVIGKMRRPMRYLQS